jgi:hypothetical protein
VGLGFPSLLFGNIQLLQLSIAVLKLQSALPLGGLSMATTGTAPAKEEVSFYSDNDGVRVTGSRLIIGGTTYAMLNITSVSCASEAPSRIGPLFFLIIGALSLIGGITASTPGAAGFGVFLLAIGGLWWKVQKAKYHLRIASASGEANAITSTDKQRVSGIVQAVNEAIIGRG